MSEEFPKEDFQKMQQQAIDRVREMQKKAAFEQPPKGQTQQRSSRFFPSGERQPDRQPFQNRTGQQPANNPSKNPESRKPESASHEPEKEERERSKGPLFPGLNSLSPIFNMDNDMSLILPLVMLLGKDGADDMLLLALIYIMT